MHCLCQCAHDVRCERLKPSSPDFFIAFIAFGGVYQNMSTSLYFVGVHQITSTSLYLARRRNTGRRRMSMAFLVGLRQQPSTATKITLIGASQTCVCHAFVQRIRANMCSRYRDLRPVTANVNRCLPQQPSDPSRRLRSTFTRPRRCM